MNRNSGMNSDGIVRALTSKPEGLLLLAAGIALMMRSGKSEPQALRSNGNRHERRRRAAQQHEHEDDSRWGFSEGISNAADRATQAAGQARDYVSGITGRTAETASAYATSMTDSVSDYADRARRGLVDGSEQIAETVQETAQRIFREQPLSIALAGLAAGAAVAAVLPATDVEGRMFGPARQKFAEAVGQAGEQLKSAGARAGERLAEVAIERGLSASGLKDAARDVAGTFGDALAEDADTEQRGTSSAKPSGATPPRAS